jgi:hypothetical protein
MSTIKGYVTELQQLNHEIKIQLKNLRDLRGKVNQIETYIQQYLISKQQNGLKYNGTAILLDNNEKPKRKKQKDITNDSINILKKYDIENPEQLLSELTKIKKGSPEKKVKLKLKKYKV